jgi:hypothetical protein
VLLAISIAAATLYGAAPASANGPFTWTGDGGPSWSSGASWAGFAAPWDGDSLVFPGTNTGTACGIDCYAGTDDLSGLEATGLTIDDAAGYDFTGWLLGIGAGGITATTSFTDIDPSKLEMPIALSTGQNWSVDGGPSGAGYLVLAGGVTGSSDALGVGLSNVGYLDFDNGSDNEVGPLTITGASTSQHGLNAYNNGAIQLSGGARLDSTDGNTTNLTDAAIFGDGSIGPLASQGGVIAPGDPIGRLAVDGGLTLDSASAVQFAIADAGTTAGTDFSDLTASGAVALGGAGLDITGGDDANDCPTLSSGAVYTLLHTLLGRSQAHSEA